MRLPPLTPDERQRQKEQRRFKSKLYKFAPRGYQRAPIWFCRDFPGSWNGTAFGATVNDLAKLEDWFYWNAQPVNGVKEGAD